MISRTIAGSSPQSRFWIKWVNRVPPFRCLHLPRRFHHLQSMQLSITYIGGPTAILAFNGLRFLTDPTFDPSGAERSSGPVTLHKSSGPALAASQIGKINAVLLSHEHHLDNLDDAGRALLPSAGKV